ncbi:MAG: 3-hydroxy-2-methylbutyryl-CoA dehydrogenase [Frankiales bacterium]|nr:3-hydroxy-2-methylbutyryl-CoA dehydrogenase [Frankiales bacterium]
MRLEGNSALVTGGAGGLGAATTRRLAAAGAAVVIADLADDNAKLLADELGERVRYVRTDVTQEDDVLAALAVARELGPVRVAVNAHGAMGAGGRIVNREGVPLPLDAFKKTIEVYLTGTYNVLRLAAAEMVKSEPEGESGRGVIINTASIAAFEGQIGQVPYAAAKGGVVGMTIVAARDLSPSGVRVVTIAPGTFYTPAYPMSEEEASERFGKGIPFPARMGRPTEYAALVQSIVENDYLNGETIRLDAALRFAPK